MTEPKTHLSQPRIIATQEFIKKNKLQLHSQEKLSQEFKKIQEEGGMFDFRPEVLINFLSFENAKPFLNEDYLKDVEAGNKKWEYITTIEEATQDFLDYMNFAWGKAEDQRGLSASRSIEKLGIWLWIMSRSDLQAVISDDNLYNPYGAPALIEVCRLMDIEVPESLVEFAKVKCE